MISHDVLQHFVSRFISRRDDYALQQPTGRYVRANRPLMQNMLRHHLDGIETVGTYVIDERGMCRYAVFDADGENGLDVLLLLCWQLVEEGIPSSLEQSRRGGHLWVLLDGLYPASVVRRWLLPFCPVGVEFYPKQDEGCGYGSLIRLPLGLHLRSGCRYPFLTWSDEDGHLVPVAASVADTLQWLAMAERVAVPTALLADQLAPRAALSASAPPSLAPAVLLPTRAPSTTTIHDWCLSQDAVTVIGHYVPLDYRGMGCCPFGEHHRSGRDTHPSLRVYPPRSATASCWYCYTAHAGGNLFDFLSCYHHLDIRTLWQHILAGAVF